MSEWVNLDETQPPCTGSYIVCTESGKVCTARWYKPHKKFCGRVGKYIVAWMHLPEPPKEE